MCGHDSPAFAKPHPHLALPATNQLTVNRPLEFQCDAAEVASERNDVKPPNRSTQVYWRAPFAESGDLIDAVQILCQSDTHGMRGVPEQASQRFDIVPYKSCFVPRIKGLQLQHDFRTVDFRIIDCRITNFRIIDGQG